MSDIKYTGGCLCGSVSYTISSEPKLAYGCYCKFCQRVTGAAFRAGMTIDKSALQFSGDKTATFKYVHPEHGRALITHFCGKCGTNIGTELERFPDVQVITLGTLDQPDEIDVSLHMYADEALHWVAFNESDTVYPAHRLNPDGSPATSRRTKIKCTL